MDSQATPLLVASLGALSQTFPVLRPINIACEIYETRLDTSDGVFEQLLIPSNSVFTDGEIPLYLSSNGITENFLCLYF